MDVAPANAPRTLGRRNLGTWPKCADENGSCSCNGVVKYGHGNNWKEKTATGSISCSNGEFGDPKPGTVKACYCSGCTFRAVNANECPSQRNLQQCHARNMEAGELCESDSGDTVNLPSLNNCGGWDIVKLECFTPPATIAADDVGDCDVKTKSIWDGKIEATYTSCSGIPAAATFIVKVSEITGIKNCPLFNDWVFSVGCPNGVCPLNIGFEISLDMCDLLAAIATGGASAAAKSAAKALGKQVGKKMSKKWQRDMAQKMADNVGNKVSKEIRKSDVGKGLCADIEASIGVALQCIFNAEKSVKIPGLQEALEIFNGGITLQLNVGMEFVIASRSIRNVALDLGFGVDIPEVAPAAWAITILAKTIDDIPSQNCNKNDPFKIAKEMSAGIQIKQSGISGQFQIKCGDSQLFKTMEEVGKQLKKGAEEVGKAVNHASGEVKKSLQKAQQGVRDVCNHVKSKKNDCKNVSEKVCSWISGRRQLESDEMEDRRILQTDRRNLFWGGRRRRRWNPLKHVCNTITKQVCNVVDVVHC